MTNTSGSFSVCAATAIVTLSDRSLLQTQSSTTPIVLNSRPPFSFSNLFWRCSDILYLVHDVIDGNVPTSFSIPALVFECFWNVKALQEVPDSLSGCSYHPCFATLIFGVLDQLGVCLKTALTSPNAWHTWLSQNMPKWCANTMHWHALTVSDRIEFSAQWIATSISCVASIHGEISTWHHEMDIKRVRFCPRTWNTQLSPPHWQELPLLMKDLPVTNIIQYQDNDIVCILVPVFDSSPSPSMFPNDLGIYCDLNHSLFDRAVENHLGWLGPVVICHLLFQESQNNVNPMVNPCKPAIWGSNMIQLPDPIRSNKGASSETNSVRADRRRDRRQNWCHRALFASLPRIGEDDWCFPVTTGLQLGYNFPLTLPWEHFKGTGIAALNLLNLLQKSRETFFRETDARSGRSTS